MKKFRHIGGIGISFGQIVVIETPIYCVHVHYSMTDTEKKVSIEGPIPFERGSNSWNLLQNILSEHIKSFSVMEKWRDVDFEIKDIRDQKIIFAPVRTTVKLCSDIVFGEIEGSHQSKDIFIKVAFEQMGLEGFKLGSVDRYSNTWKLLEDSVKSYLRLKGVNPDGYCLDLIITGLLKKDVFRLRLKSEPEDIT